MRGRIGIATAIRNNSDFIIHICCSEGSGQNDATKESFLAISSSYNDGQAPGFVTDKNYLLYTHGPQQDI